ncbi:MAG TPA: 50S ribosomal protein L23 [Planctomycetota bacterium]|nr:50S ribosomal protein L23 [Planctomycetota bacterium]
MNPYEIVRRPRISEKTVHLQNKLSSYTFEVHPDANKIQIREAIKAFFKVDVLAVNTMNCRGKDRRMRNNRQPGVTAAWKKAIVKIADGQKIEGV